MSGGVKERGLTAFLLIIYNALVFFNRTFYNFSIFRQKSVVSKSVAHEQNQSGKLCKNCEEMKQPSLQLTNLLMAH